MSSRLPFLLCGFLFVAVVVAGITGCKDDGTTESPGTTVVPITGDLFPLVPGHKFTYTGYATSTSTTGGVPLPDSGNVYRTVWTVGPTVPSPLGGTAVALIDSTRLYVPGIGVITSMRTLMVKRDSANGDFYFMQTIGPFKRAFDIPVGTAAADTLIFIPIVRPAMGAGGTGVSWTAYDQTFTSSPSTGSQQIRLEIIGRIEAQEVVTDSAASPAQHTVYRARTARRITVSGTVVQNDAETARLWLETGVGPIQIRIVEDPENFGHWRFFTGRNF